jgi:hypothetical protein
VTGPGCVFDELFEKRTAKRRYIPSFLNIRVSVKRCCGHEMVTILALLAGMTEAESARLGFSCHLTRELGESMFGNKYIALMHTSMSVSNST